MNDKPNVINFLTNNGVTSNLLAGGLFALPSLFIRQIAGCVGEAWATIIVAVSFSAFIGIVFSWINRREHVIARRLGFVRLLPDGFKRDEYIEEKEISSPDAAMPRQALQDEIAQWVQSENESGCKSRVCIVCGEKSLGRQTLACAGVWMYAIDTHTEKQFRIYCCKSSFSANRQHGFADANEWESVVKTLIRSFSKKRRYLVVLSDVRPGEWLAAVRHLVNHANNLGRHVLFLVKAASGTSAREAEVRDLKSEGGTLRSIDPLTAIQCGRFVRKYAERANWDDRLDRLQKKFESTDCALSFDRWCFACSGGRPKRLIAFLENEGCSTLTLTSCLIRDLESVGFKPDAIRAFVPFLWCLCLEKMRMANLNANGQVDVDQIVRRLNCDGLGELGKLAAEFWGDRLWPKMAVSKLDEHFLAAAVKIPEEMLVASLGAGEGESGFQTGIASWLNHVIMEGAEQPYVETIVDAVVNALQCGGAYVSENGGVRAAFAAIDGLKRALGAFAGQEDAEMLDGRAEAFFSAMREELLKRIMIACIDGLGFLEDESVVRMASAVLDECTDEREFLTYYRTALPLFGLTICNPVELAAVRRMREIATRELMAEKVDTLSIVGMLPDFLCTVLLCVFRAPHMSRQMDESLFNREDDFVCLLDRLPRRICAATGHWHDLVDALDNDDAWNMSRAMSAIMDSLPQVPVWDSVYVLFAVIAVYMNDLCGDVKDFLWPRILRGLDGCRLPHDSRGVIRDLARYPVLWRRAYRRYLSRECSPWAISAQIDDAQNRLKDLDSLTQTEVLRYLPELVRHFALCVQAKARGDKRYVEVLHAGWQKIQDIAECEDWFKVVNRRSRYWVVSWSVQIVRDAMSDEEREKFYDRLQTLTREIRSDDAPWYHVKLLGACERLADDPLSLQRLLLPVERLVFDRYGDPSNGILCRADRRCLYDSWFECALKWFTDHLVDAAEKVSSFDALTRILEVICGRPIAPTPDSVLNEFICTYRDPKALERVFVTPCFMDRLLFNFVVDQVNRDASGVSDENSIGLVQLLKTSEEMQTILKERLDAVLQDEEMEEGDGQNVCIWLVDVVFTLFVNPPASDAFTRVEFCSLLERALLASERLVSQGCYVPMVVIALEQVQQCAPKGTLLDRSMAVCNDAIEAYIGLMRDWIPSEEVDVASEDQWLGNLWDCPSTVLKRMPDDLGKRICEHLNRIACVYSTNWLEKLKSNWFYSILCVFLNLPLACCPEDLFTLVENLALDGRFAHDCQVTEALPGKMVLLLNRLVEERTRRGGGSLAAKLLIKYRQYWESLKRDVWGACTDDQLSEEEWEWRARVDKALGICV